MGQNESRNGKHKNSRAQEKNSPHVAHTLPEFCTGTAPSSSDGRIIDTNPGVGNKSPHSTSSVPNLSEGSIFEKNDIKDCKNLVQVTTTSSESIPYKIMPEVNDPKMDLKGFGIPGCNSTENISHDIPSNTGNINNTNIPVAVRDIRHVPSVKKNQSNFYKESHNSSTKNINYSSSDILGNQSCHTTCSSDASCLISGMSEISQNTNFPKSTPLFFDPLPLVPSVKSADQSIPVETNKETALDNSIGNINLKTTYRRRVKNMKPNTSDHTEIKSKVQNIRLKKKKNPKIGLKNSFNKSVNSTTLKHIEELADSVCDFSPHDSGNNMALSVKPQNIGNIYDKKIILYTLEECINNMTNIDVHNKNMVCFLQKSLLKNLQAVNSFISVLTSCPILNEQLLNEFKLLRNVVLSFSSDKLPWDVGECAAFQQNTPTAKSLKSDAAELGEFANSIDSWLLRESVSDIETSHKEPTAETVRNATLTSLTHLSHEMHYLHLQESGENEIVHQSDEQDQTCFSDSNKINEKQALDSNYNDLLDIMNESMIKGFVLDISMYVCRFCDFVSRSEADAKNHLSDENHKKNEVGKSKWHFCEICSLNIFGNNYFFKEHCLTAQHNNIAKLKTIKQDQYSPGNNTHNIMEEKFDSASVCSSTSDLSNKGVHEQPIAHEILLSRAKVILKTNHGNAVGLYCQICNEYILYPSDVDHFQTKKHQKKILRVHNKYSLSFCYTCKVYLFVDRKELEEHYTMPLHLELYSSGGKINAKSEAIESELDDTSKPELSNVEGPHFDLMKAIIQKHLNEEPTKTFFGYYCHICPAYSLDEFNWISHKNNPFHFSQINSTNYVGKQLYHECKVCNIILIGCDDIFSLHEKSLVHQAIFRKQQKINQSIKVNEDGYKPSSENGLSEEEDTDDSDSENSNANGSVSQSTNSSNKPNNKHKNTIPNGIYVKGLPKDLEQRDLFLLFKNYGFINHYALNKDICTGKIIFRSCDAVQNLLEKKHLYIFNKKIYIHPLQSLDQSNKKKRKRKAVKLAGAVLEVFSSQHSLEEYVKSKQNELYDIKESQDSNKKMIEQKIYSLLPKCCKVHFFGSQVTGLATPESDLDVYIDFDNRSFFNELSHEEQKTRLSMLLKQLTHPNSGFIVKEQVFDARVPIIRAFHIMTKTPCDISCRSGISVENSELIRLFMQADNRVYWLMIVVKWWMRSNRLLDRSIFTSYAMSWLVIFFLMQIQMLSSLEDLQRGCVQYSVAHWDCRYSRDIKSYTKTKISGTGFDLLLQFFLFYGNYDFKPVVLCPLIGNPIPRRQFETMCLPAAFKPYVDKVTRWPENTEKLRICNPICLQDPFELSHNITKGVSGKDLKRFREACLLSAELCSRFKN